MKEQYKQQIKKIFEDNGGYARTQDIIEAGIHTSYLYQLVEENVITKLKRGLYHWDDGEFTVEEELVQVSKIAPNSVFCLISALSYYEMTTQSPWEHYVAIHQNARRPVVPDYPPIRFFYFSDKQFETGIKEIEINENIIKMYDLEKALCDCLRLRNRIGMEVAKEALQEYVKRSDRDITKLLDYAEITGISILMEKYLEILI
ncbi:type IV toxin-antitoxin system AbiEi family antitoxin domain-containing protein [Fuchsiella alkaliacetigena]|uniref:type IV toxin-antitoxin system AbiEi family antitoxin domain-containing protein n=1 Tax=Fuchsiella alkaliacetigena TaxID=957042 RepID=UPI002009E902|nr:type IV toxin-antitoxin system AbiEi family antitoxin domain-containing protein [Fuchsiella alkaliacetigena]MCK8825952.1 type IV toxin-antitoxin system AbiEi family antitoxin domain-containing protein [Fuchsiella alkaliacetigena]